MSSSKREATLEATTATPVDPYDGPRRPGAGPGLARALGRRAGDAVLRPDMTTNARSSDVDALIDDEQMLGRVKVARDLASWISSYSFR